MLKSPPSDRVENEGRNRGRAVGFARAIRIIAPELGLTEPLLDTVEPAAMAATRLTFPIARS
jgi:hypothetical protein